MKWGKQSNIHSSDKLLIMHFHALQGDQSTTEEKDKKWLQLSRRSLSRWNKTEHTHFLHACLAVSDSL